MAEDFHVTCALDDGTCVEVTRINRSGYVFSDFFAMRSSADGPGWFVFGRNAEKYGVDSSGKGLYIMLVARPDVKPRRAKGWNGTPRRGWRTQKEARRIVELLNRNDL